MNLENKFNQLSKAKKMLVCFISIVILGSFLFFMGNEIGIVIFKALH
jgi:hypothetical protein